MCIKSKLYDNLLNVIRGNTFERYCNEFLEVKSTAWLTATKCVSLYAQGFVRSLPQQLISFPGSHDLAPMASNYALMHIIINYTKNNMENTVLLPLSLQFFPPPSPFLPWKGKSLKLNL